MALCCSESYASLQGTAQLWDNCRASVAFLLFLLVFAVFERALALLSCIDDPTPLPEKRSCVGHSVHVSRACRASSTLRVQFRRIGTVASVLG